MHLYKQDSYVSRCPLANCYNVNAWRCTRWWWTLLEKVIHVHPWKEAETFGMTAMGIIPLPNSICKVSTSDLYLIPEISLDESLVFISLHHHTSLHQSASASSLNSTCSNHLNYLHHRLANEGIAMLGVTLCVCASAVLVSAPSAAKVMCCIQC